MHIVVRKYEYVHVYKYIYTCIKSNGSMDRVPVTEKLSSSSSGEAQLLVFLLPPDNCCLHMFPCSCCPLPTTYLCNLTTAIREH